MRKKQAEDAARKHADVQVMSHEDALAVLAQIDQRVQQQAAQKAEEAQRKQAEAAASAQEEQPQNEQTAEETKRRQEEEALEAAEQAAEVVAQLKREVGESASAEASSQTSSQFSPQAQTQASQPSPQVQAQVSEQTSPQTESKLQRNLREQRAAKKGEAAAEDKPASQDAQSADTKKKQFSIAKIAIGTVLTVFLIALAAFSITRWATVNDAADIQGTWYVAGTSSPVIITDTEIQLAENVNYEYTLDAAAKTLAFDFSNLSGQAHYRFSLDRNQLAFLDGEYTLLSSTTSDIGWLFQLAGASMKGEEYTPAGSETENVILLTREAQ